MMWIIWPLIGLAVASGQRESGKAECDRNFSRNSFQEASTLVPICHRGCDMYVVAFISTSLSPKTDNLPHLSRTATNTQHPKNVNIMEANSIDSLKKKQGSKTTAEPNLQPVQDLPEKAGDQTTTMKIPNRDKSSADSQKLANSTEGQQKKETEMETVEKTLQMRIENAKHTCRHACIVAYGEVAEVEACVVGCHLQSKAEQESEKQAGKTTGSSLMAIESSMVNLVGHIGHVVRVSWSWAFPKTKIEKSSRIEEYGSLDSMKPQVIPFIPTSFNLKSAIPREQLKRTNMIGPDVLHLLQTFHNDLPLEPDLFKNIDKQMIEVPPYMFEHNIHNTRAGQEHKLHHVGTHEQKIHKERKDHHRQKLNHDVDDPRHQKESLLGIQPRIPPWIKSPEVRQSLDILECISRKSGLPRWFIAATMFSSIPVALWLCFSLTSPPDETKVAKTKIVDEENTLECDTTDEKSDLLSYDDCVKSRFEIV